MLSKDQFFALVDLVDPEKVFNISFDRTAWGDKVTIHYPPNGGQRKGTEATYFWSPIRKWVTELDKR